MPTTILTKLYNAQGNDVIDKILAEELGLSEAVLHGHIEALRQEGYDITGEINRGFSLNNWQTLIIPDEVRSKLPEYSLFQEIIYYPILDSTSVLAKELASGGAPRGTVIIAGKQRAGKGRMGRKWESPPGGLWFSIILRPDLPLHKLPFLSLAFAVSIAEGIEEHTGETCQVKWPNDVILRDKKVAGILLEVNSSSEDKQEVILGIGVNLNQEDFGELNYKATSIKRALNQETLSNDILPILLSNLEKNYNLFLNEGFEPIRRKFKAKCNHLGKGVNINRQDKLIAGINIDIDSQGSLVIAAEGQEIRLTTGEVNIF